MRAREELEHGEAATRELASRLEKPVGTVSNYVDATPASSGAPRTRQRRGLEHLGAPLGPSGAWDPVEARAPGA